jgi:hypothetical protein
MYSGSSESMYDKKLQQLDDILEVIKLRWARRDGNRQRVVLLDKDVPITGLVGLACIILLSNAPSDLAKSVAERFSQILGLNDRPLACMAKENSVSRTQRAYGQGQAAQQVVDEAGESMSGPHAASETPPGSATLPGTPTEAGRGTRDGYHNVRALASVRRFCIIVLAESECSTSAGMIQMTKSLKAMINELNDKMQISVVNQSKINEQLQDDMTALRGEVVRLGGEVARIGGEVARLNEGQMRQETMLREILDRLSVSPK